MTPAIKQNPAVHGGSIKKRRPRILWSKVISVARKRKQFTVNNLLPIMTRDQATYALKDLVNRKEIVLVKKGTVGRYATPSVFRLSKQL